MTAAPRHPRHAKAGSGQQAQTDNPSQKRAGRPKGPPSTIVNLRIPLDLLAQQGAARAGIGARQDSAELRATLAALRGR